MGLKSMFYTFFLVLSLAMLGLPEQPMAMPKAAASTNIPIVSGTVIETMDASGYTYMLVDSDGTETWVAIPATTIEKGAKIKYYDGMVMKNFTSKTLNRTFDAVVFSSGLAGNEDETAPQPATEPTNDSFSAAVNAEKEKSMPASAMTLSGGSAAATAPMEDVSIQKAPGTNGYTVAEIYNKAETLSGKKVQVHGKVVKFNPMIMGKNWIHLQDGTGDPMHNSHDLVVTSSQSAEIGKIITIEGVLAAHKDFGAGYKYAAIVEDAAIIK